MVDPMDKDTEHIKDQSTNLMWPKVANILSR